MLILLHTLLTVAPQTQPLPTGSIVRDPIGFVLATGPDLDGDGIAELLVADPDSKWGRVFAISLKKQAVLLSSALYQGEGDSEISLCTVTPTSETHGWVAVVGSEMHATNGRAVAFSGTTPTPRTLLDSAQDELVVLGPCGNAGDVDGDGRGDVWLSVRNSKSGKYSLEVRSLESGKHIASVPYENGIDENTPKTIRYGCVVYSNWEIEHAYVSEALFGDFDGNGRQDCLMGRWRSAEDKRKSWDFQSFTIGSPAPNKVHVWDQDYSDPTLFGAEQFVSVDGERCLVVRHGNMVHLLRRVDLVVVMSVNTKGVGSSDRVVALRDGDKALPVLAVPNPRYGNDLGRITILTCSKQPEVVRTIQGDATMLFFGSQTLNAGDLTGDGLDDIATTCFSADANGLKSGRIILVSTATGNRIGEIQLDGAKIPFR